MFVCACRKCTMWAGDQVLKRMTGQVFYLSHPRKKRKRKLCLFFYIPKPKPPKRHFHRLCGAYPHNILLFSYF